MAHTAIALVVVCHQGLSFLRLTADIQHLLPKCNGTFRSPSLDSHNGRWCSEHPQNATEANSEWVFFTERAN